MSLAGLKVQYQRTYFDRAGIELAIAIDVSKSMLAEDVSFPLEGRRLFNVLNRLNRARYFALNFLSELHGERIGAYLFANIGVEVIPFTRDYGYCRYILRHINDADITVPGSDLGDAIRTGIAMLESSHHAGEKVIVLISDGEDITLDKSSLYESAQRAASKRIKIFTVGVGTGKGVLIPIRSQDGISILDYYVDEDGSYLKTSLVQDTLRNIASITGGLYLRVTDENASANLMESVLQQAKFSEKTKSVEPAWFDLSPFLLMAGLAFFIVGILTTL